MEEKVVLNKDYMGLKDYIGKVITGFRVIGTRNGLAPTRLEIEADHKSTITVELQDLGYQYEPSIWLGIYTDSGEEEWIR